MNEALYAHMNNKRKSEKKKKRKRKLKKKKENSTRKSLQMAATLRTPLCITDISSHALKAIN
jgi:hypothetical protein